MPKVLHRNRQFSSYAVGEGDGMHPPCNLGLTDGHFNISATKLRITLKFSGNLGILRLHLCPFNLIGHTCAYARWAHMHRFLSVCPSFIGPKFRLENYSYLRN